VEFEALHLHGHLAKTGWTGNYWENYCLLFTTTLPLSTNLCFALAIIFDALKVLITARMVKNLEI
jgi:hypothetical protein